MEIMGILRNSPKIPKTLKPLTPQTPISSHRMEKVAQKSFVLRIDAATMNELERWAEDEFRSVNGQLQWIIADALRRSGRLKKTKKKQTDGTDPTLPL